MPRMLRLPAQGLDDVHAPICQAGSVLQDRLESLQIGGAAAVGPSVEERGQQPERPSGLSDGPDSDGGAVGAAGQLVAQRCRVGPVRLDLEVASGR